MKIDKLDIDNVKNTDCFSFILNSASRLTSRFYNKFIRQNKLTIHQFHILLAIKNNKYRSKYHLSIFLGLERTTLSRKASLLIKKGFITNEIVSGSTKSYQLTPKGLELIKEATPNWLIAQKEFFKLNKEGFEDLISRLQGISASLDDFIITENYKSKLNLAKIKRKKHVK